MRVLKELKLTLLSLTNYSSKILFTQSRIQLIL